MCIKHARRWSYEYRNPEECGISSAGIKKLIDKYFGKLNMHFGFKDENTVGIHMIPVAEDFLKEYSGYAMGIAN